MTVNSSALLLAASIIVPSSLRPQSPTTTLPIAFSGEVRQRSDWDRPTGTSADLATYLRSRLGLRAEPSAGLSFFVQLQDSRVYGAESNGTATAPDQFDVHQGYLQLSGTHTGNSLSLRAGRQEIAFGNERLVGASNWTNNGRAFDGVLFSVAPTAPTKTTTPSSREVNAAWTANLFAATVDERGRRLGAPGSAGTRNDHEALGGYATRALGASALMDATLLYDIAGQYRAYDRSNRATADLRLRSASPFAFRAELEAAYQFGAQRYLPAVGAPAAQNIGAWLLGARLGTPQHAGGRANAVVGVDVLSGDATPTNRRYGAFNTMYATNHPFYGLLDLFTDPAGRTNDRGLVDSFAQTSWQANASYGLHAELHRFSSAADQTGVPTGPLGWEGDVNVPYRFSPAVTVEGGYSLFRAGPGAAGLTLGAAGQLHHWLYLQLRAGF